MVNGGQLKNLLVVLMISSFSPIPGLMLPNKFSVCAMIILPLPPPSLNESLGPGLARVQYRYMYMSASSKSLLRSYQGFAEIIGLMVLICWAKGCNCVVYCMLSLITNETYCSLV